MAQEKDSGFPFFEEDNYLGWLVHYKALLCSPDYSPWDGVKASNIVGYPVTLYQIW
jgi:hypothetical protein